MYCLIWKIARTKLVGFCFSQNYGLFSAPKFFPLKFLRIDNGHNTIVYTSVAYIAGLTSYRSTTVPKSFWNRIWTWILVHFHQLIVNYCKVTSSRPFYRSTRLVYNSILNSLGQRSQYISIKFTLHKQSENPFMCYYPRQSTAHDFTVGNFFIRWNNKSGKDSLPKTTNSEVFVQCAAKFCGKKSEFVDSGLVIWCQELSKSAFLNFDRLFKYEKNSGI